MLPFKFCYAKRVGEIWKKKSQINTFYMTSWIAQNRTPKIKFSMKHSPYCISKLFHQHIAKCLCSHMFTIQMSTNHQLAKNGSMLRDSGSNDCSMLGDSGGPLRISATIEKRRPFQRWWKWRGRTRTPGLFLCRMTNVFECHRDLAGFLPEKVLWFPLYFCFSKTFFAGYSEAGRLCPCTAYDWSKGQRCAVPPCSLEKKAPNMEPCSTWTTYLFSLQHGHKCSKPLTSPQLYLSYGLRFPAVTATKRFWMVWSTTLSSKTSVSSAMKLVRFSSFGCPYTHRYVFSFHFRSFFLSYPFMSITIVI